MSERLQGADEHKAEQLGDNGVGWAGGCGAGLVDCAGRVVWDWHACGRAGSRKNGARQAVWRTAQPATQPQATCSHASSWAGRAGWGGSALALTQARRAPAHPHQGPPAESNKTNRQASSCVTLASGCIQLPNCMRVCRAAGTASHEHRHPPVRRCRSQSRTPCARGTPRCCSGSRDERL